MIPHSYVLVDDETGVPWKKPSTYLYLLQVTDKLYNKIFYLQVHVVNLVVVGGDQRHRIE
jgi:hypothetical protein